MAKENLVMRTYPLSKLWHRTVEGTDLEYLNWNDIAMILVAAGIIELIPDPSTKAFLRYRETGLFPDVMKEDYKAQVLVTLRAGLKTPLSELAKGKIRET